MRLIHKLAIIRSVLRITQDFSIIVVSDTTCSETQQGWAEPIKSSWCLVLSKVNQNTKLM